MAYKNITALHWPPNHIPTMSKKTVLIQNLLRKHTPLVLLKAYDCKWPNHPCAWPWGLHKNKIKKHLEIAVLFFNTKTKALYVQVRQINSSTEKMANKKGNKKLHGIPLTHTRTRILVVNSKMLDFIVKQARACGSENYKTVWHLFQCGTINDRYSGGKPRSPHILLASLEYNFVPTLR